MVVGVAFFRWSQQQRQHRNRPGRWLHIAPLGRLGARNGGSVASAINLKTLVIYETAVTDANVERISPLLG